MNKNTVKPLIDFSIQVKLYSKKMFNSTNNLFLVKKHLSNDHFFAYPLPTVAKSTAGRENPVFSRMAKNSTPQACFFIRSTCTPKERRLLACSSMVACSGQGIALGCLPFLAVFSPRYTLSPYTVRSVADSSPKFSRVELLAMKLFAYSFLCVNRCADTYQEEVVRIIADSEQNARFQLTADYRLALSSPIAKIRLNPTACTQAQGGIYA